MKNPLHAELFG